MEFVKGLGDVSGIPRYFVTRVGRGVVRDGCVVTIVLCTDDMESNEKSIAVPVVVLDWTIPGWRAARDALKGVLDEIEQLEMARGLLVPKRSLRAH